MRRNSRSKTREADKIRSLDRGVVDIHRSRGRARDNDDERKRKEQVKW